MCSRRFECCHDLWSFPTFPQSLHAKWLQSCPTLCNPMDYSQPASSVHGILLARILEWIAISSSRGSFQPRDQSHMSRGSYFAGRFFTTELLEKPICMHIHTYVYTHVYTHTHTHTQIYIQLAFKQCLLFYTFFICKLIYLSLIMNLLGTIFLPFHK